MVSGVMNAKMFLPMHASLDRPTSLHAAGEQVGVGQREGVTHREVRTEGRKGGWEERRAEGRKDGEEERDKKKKKEDTSQNNMSEQQD